MLKQKCLILKLFKVSMEQSRSFFDKLNEEKEASLDVLTDRLRQENTAESLRNCQELCFHLLTEIKSRYEPMSNFYNNYDWVGYNYKIQFYYFERQFTSILLEIMFKFDVLSFFLIIKVNNLFIATLSFVRIRWKKCKIYRI